MFFKNLKKKNVSEREDELASLVDAAFEIVELYKPSSPSQVQWKKDWLSKARKLVPQF